MEQNSSWEFNYNDDDNDNNDDDNDDKDDKLYQAHNSDFKQLFWNKINVIPVWSVFPLQWA